MDNCKNRSRAKIPASNPAEKKETRGGKREGSGRKRLDSELKKKMVTFRLAPDVIGYLDSQDRPKSQVIEEAIRKNIKDSSN